MSLISKQIDELRAYAKDSNGELAKLINDAADTIEVLSAKLHTSNMERSSRYHHEAWLEEYEGIYVCGFCGRRTLTPNYDIFCPSCGSIMDLKFANKKAEYIYKVITEHRRKLRMARSLGNSNDN